ncbi:MAG TPA: YceI family protein [Bacteroidales bacterium]|nr:YceI family protein [Bacteroidales bacterium]
MKKLVLLSAIAIVSLAGHSQTKWNVDKVHSNVGFTVQHMVISEVDGSFKVFDGSIVAKNADFTDADINFTVDIKSINTDNEMRDNHLKSADFFDADKYPQMVFKSISFKKLTGNKYELIGTLTIKGVSKQVKLDVTYGGTAKDPYGNIKSGFKVSGIINRFDYGLKWNTLTEAGGAMVGQDVVLNIKLEFTQVK